MLKIDEELKDRIEAVPSEDSCIPDGTEILEAEYGDKEQGIFVVAGKVEDSTEPEGYWLFVGLCKFDQEGSIMQNERLTGAVDSMGEAERIVTELRLLCLLAESDEVKKEVLE